MRRRMAAPAAVATAVALLVSACGDGPTSMPTPTATATPMVTLPPTPVPAPSATPVPTSTPAPSVEDANHAPRIEGDTLCIGPAGQAHVFDLTLIDRDGDVLSWRARKVHGRGRLSPVAGSGVASRGTITIVYTPPAQPDTNEIVVTVTDGRGGMASITLRTKSG